MTEPDDRVTARAKHLLPEEKVVGSADPERQAEAILEESDRRQEDRETAPDAELEQRTSDEATPPV